MKPLRSRAALRRPGTFVRRCLAFPLAGGAIAVIAAEPAPMRAPPAEPVADLSDGPLLTGLRLTAFQPAAEGAIPTLPKTVVEAEAEGPPQAPPQPAPPVPQPFPPGPVDPLAGSIFESPFQSAPSRGYGATSTTAGSVTNTPLVDVPASIQVVTQDVMSDLQLFGVADTFRFVSGVNLTDSFGLGLNYNMRGFTATSRRWNGFNDRIFRIAGIDTGNIDRIEFLKGPASLIYGSSSPGGFLNIVTKKPLPDSYTRMGVSTGSWGFVRTDLDINRPLNEEGTVLFRYNLALQSSDSYRDFVMDDRILAAGAISWIIDDDTTFTLEQDFLNISTLSDTGLLPVNGQLEALPVNRLLNDPSDQYQGPTTRVAAYLDRTVNDEWAFRLGGFTFFNRLDFLSHFGSGVPSAAGILNQTHFRGTEAANNLGAQAYVVGTRPVLEMENEIVFGIEGDYMDTGVTRRVGGAPLYPLDVFNPIYQDSFPNTPTNPNTVSRNWTTGLFVQDGLWISETVRLLGGVRYDNNDNVLNNITAGSTVRRNDNAWTPRAGIVYEPIRDVLSGWYSYTESFGVGAIESGGRRFSGNPLAPDGGPLDPEFGHQHELGIKLADPDGAFLLTASIFRIRRENFTIGSGIPGFSIQSGAAQSQGIEFDFGGAVTENLSITANYAYIDARTVHDANVAEIGRQLRQVPYNKANLWTRYNFYDDEDGAFGVGFGVQWTDESRTFLAAAPILPSFVKFDAGLFYREGRFFANTNFDNLTDIRYFTTGSSTGFDVGAPFTIRATAGITY